MSEEDKKQRYTELKKLRDNFVNDVKAPLYEYRTENHYFPVIGEGAPDASIIFVGEAPGENEAKTGRPFCGAAGKFLNVMLESIGLDRKRVYITNLVKDRPPGNRDPLPEEIAYYSPLLVKQLEIIKPSCVVTLGRFSMSFLLEYYGLTNNLSVISKMHGRVFTPPDYDISIVTLYHPAVALYNGSMRAVLLKDFEVLKQFIGKHDGYKKHLQASTMSQKTKSIPVQTPTDALDDFVKEMAVKEKESNDDQISLF